MPASHLARKPAGIDHVHAAGAPMSGLTARQFLIELGHNETEPAATGAASPGAAQPQDDARQWCRGRCGTFRGAAGKVEGRARHRGGIGNARVVPAPSYSWVTFSWIPVEITMRCPNRGTACAETLSCRGGLRRKGLKSFGLQLILSPLSATTEPA